MEKLPVAKISRLVYALAHCELYVRPCMCVFASFCSYFAALLLFLDRRCASLYIPLVFRVYTEARSGESAQLYVLDN